MTIEDRANFLSWLRKLDQQELHDVQTLVSSMISAQKAYKIRHVLPGEEIVVNVNGDTHVGTVIRTNKVSVLIYDQLTRKHITIQVDNIHGIHLGNLEFQPLKELDAAPPQANFDVES